MSSLSVPHSVLHVQVDCRNLPKDMDQAKAYINGKCRCEATVPGPGGQLIKVIIHMACIQAAMLLNVLQYFGNL